MDTSIKGEQTLYVLTVTPLEIRKISCAASLARNWTKPPKATNLIYTYAEYISDLELPVYFVQISTFD